MQAAAAAAETLVVVEVDKEALPPEAGPHFVCFRSRTLLQCFAL